MSPTLVLIAGLPGSGKSTLARRLAVSIPAVRLCPDDWMHALQVDYADEGFRDRLETQFWLHARELLGRGQSVVLEWGLWVRAHREDKRAWARDHGVRVELHVLDVPLEERWRRIQRRTAEGQPGTVPVTYPDLASYDRFFELPDAEERARYNAPGHGMDVSRPKG